jgi:hypothetical protein
MVRVRAAFTLGQVVPVPRCEQSFKDRDDKRRVAVLEKHRYGFNYELGFNPLR